MLNMGQRSHCGRSSRSKTALPQASPTPPHTTPANRSGQPKELRSNVSACTVQKTAAAARNAMRNEVTPSGYPPGVASGRNSSVLLGRFGTWRQDVAVGDPVQPLVQSTTSFRIGAALRTAQVWSGPGVAHTCPGNGTERPERLSVDSCGIGGLPDLHLTRLGRPSEPLMDLVGK